MHSELLDSNYQQVPFKIMSFYTKEGFLYKDLNKLLREEPKKTKEQFAEEFDAFMPFYLRFIHTQSFKLIMMYLFLNFNFKNYFLI